MSGAPVEWVHAVERAYIAAATGASVAAPVPTGTRELRRARAAAGAVASHYLAVGTPRTLGLVCDDATVEDALASVAAHRAWFQPRALRCAGPESLAATLGEGAATASLVEALACDIVCVHAPIALAASQLRRGTHVNLLARGTLDDELRALARIVDEVPGLGQLAAGMIDGRALDELTIFVAGELQTALAAL